MKKSITRKCLLSIIIILIFSMLTQTESLAVSTWSVGAGKTNMNVGDNTTLTVTANECGGRFDISTSDASIVCIKIGSEEKSTTNIWPENNSQSIMLCAKKAGRVTITVTPISLSTSAGEDMPEGKDASKSVTITVSDPAPQQQQPVNNGSGDATLKSITVAGKTFNKPGADVTVTVDAKTTTAQISAVANHNAAKISGTGTKDLVTGTNTVTLTVTAQNGATKKYTVRIRKLADTTTTPNVSDNQSRPNQEPTPEEPVPEIIDLRLTYLMVEDVELIPEFDKETFEYRVDVTNRDSINIVAASNVEDATVEITGNKELKDGENEVIIKITKEGQQEVEYRIIVNKKTEEIVPISTEQTEGKTGGFLETTGGKAVVVGGATLLVGGLAFAISKARAASEFGANAARRARRRSSFNDFDD